MNKKLCLVICLIMFLSLATLFVFGCGTDEPVAVDDPDEVDEPEEVVEEVDEERETVSLSLATTGTGGAGYIQGGNLAAVVNPLQDVFEVYPIATTGAMENVILVDTGEADIGYTPDVQLEEGYLGTGDFERAHENIRRLFSCAISYAVFIVDADTDIYTIDDLEGKTINWGLPAQTTRAFNNVLFDVIGLEPGVNFTAVELSTGDAFNAIRDRQIDAASQGATPQMASLVELATTKDIRILEIPDDVFEEFNERVGGILFQGTLPGGWYPGVDEDVQTWIMTISYFAHKDIDDDVIYEFTKQFWENIDELRSRDAAFEGLTINEALLPLEIPLHPGAERYFEELGMIN